MAFQLQQTGAALRYGLGLKNALRDGALTQHLVARDHAGRGRAAADEPRRPRSRRVKDVFGYPVARVTYKPHAFELADAPLLRADPEAGPRERRRHARLPGAVQHAARRIRPTRAT